MTCTQLWRHLGPREVVPTQPLEQECASTPTQILTTNWSDINKQSVKRQLMALCELTNTKRFPMLLLKSSTTACTFYLTDDTRNLFSPNAAGVSPVNDKRAGLMIVLKVDIRNRQIGTTTPRLFLMFPFYTPKMVDTAGTVSDVPLTCFPELHRTPFT